jgi:hypothetical protein
MHNGQPHRALPIETDKVEPKTGWPNPVNATIVPTATHDVRFLAKATQMCRIKLPSWGAMFAMRMVQSKRAAPQI